MGVVLIKVGVASTFCARFARDTVTEPPFKKSCIRHWYHITGESLLRSEITASRANYLGDLVLRYFAALVLTWVG